VDFRAGDVQPELGALLGGCLRPARAYNVYLSVQSQLLIE
jgi:hypothetical protein